MIISMLAPKGGVGSSTLAVLMARARARTGNVLLVDAAGDRSLDLYTGTAHLIAGPYAGSIAETAVVCRPLDSLRLIRLETSKGSQWEALTEELKGLPDTDVILDHGSWEGADVAPLTASDKVLVVLTQDSQVLRAADRLVGELRDLGIQPALIVNMLEEKDPSELGSLEEIYDLFEEDHVGSFGFQHELRFAVNTGSMEAVPKETLEEAAALTEKIFGSSASAITEDTAPGPEGASAEAEPSPGVLAGIRSFFRRFRKG